MAQRYPASTTPRIDWVDTAKGMCIILVVMMHSTLGLTEALGAAGETWVHSVIAFAKPFRMPDFFLISGLFLSRVINRDWRSYADKRIVHFLYFYLLWLVIQCTVKFLPGGSPLEVARHVALGLVEPFGTLWFIYMLAVFSGVTKLLRRVSPWVLLAGAAVLQISPIHTGWTAIDEFATYYVYFVGGFLFAPLVFRLASWVMQNPLPALGGLIVWALVDGTLAFTASGFEEYPLLSQLPVISLVLGYVGAAAIVSVAALLTRFNMARALSYCGRHSIAIYLGFFLPMAATRILLVKFAPAQDYLAFASVAIIAAAVILPLLLERLVRGTWLGFLFVRPALFKISSIKRAKQQASFEGLPAQQTSAS